MSDDASEIAKLKEQIAALQKQLEQAQQVSSSASIQSGGVNVRGSKVEVGGNLVARDYIVSNVYNGPPPKDHTEALTIYRTVVASACGQLPLRGVDVGASDPTAAQKPIGLANVYVDLDTTARVKLTKDEKQKRERDAVLRGEEDTRPLGALEALIASRQMVLLGDPGGGKSTFVNHLAYCLAMNGLEPNAHWLEHLPQWPSGEKDELPVVVILRDFVRGLAEKPPRAEPQHLLSFIVDRLNAQNIEFAREPIEQALEKGRALITRRARSAAAGVEVFRVGGLRRRPDRSLRRRVVRRTGAVGRRARSRQR